MRAPESSPDSTQYFPRDPRAQTGLEIGVPGHPWYSCCLSLVDGPRPRATETIGSRKGASDTSGIICNLVDTEMGPDMAVTTRVNPFPESPRKQVLFPHALHWISEVCLSPNKGLPV